MSTNDLREYSNTPEEQPTVESPAPEAPRSSGPEMSLADVRKVYVGPGYQRYEAAFAKCDAAGKPEHSFSIAPFFFSCFWFFYRKMYFEGLIILAVTVGVSLLADAFLGASRHAVMAGVGVAVAINAKGIYWRAVDKKIAQAMKMYPSEPQKAVAWLAAKGGVNYWALAAGVIVFGLFFFYSLGR